ncbi:PD40 domain-containing protein [Frankia sp. AgW1.1]|uniref:TolB family protein n=2 Tax=Frankia TaxID=1854 RepID=UPI0019338E0B|nr:PD40 domain-containing protein [Frankia sp. AgW1.1]MBL7488053.1 PD40 domain-containing protein [Frankia sp. AgW1.1]
MTRLGKLAAGLVLVAVVAACTANGEPTPSGGSSSTGQPAARLHGTILFTRAGGPFGESTVFTAHADGTNEQQINQLPDGCCPRFSPDGTRILASATTADGRITTAIYQGAGASHPLELPDGTINLGPGAWSRDARELAFEGWDDQDPGRNGIYTAPPVDQPAVRRLTTAPAGYHDIPMDYSPDGTQLLFLRATTADGSPHGTLYLTAADGSAPRQVTPAGVDTGPARWSPDGQTIAFGAESVTAAGPLMTVHPDSTDLRPVFTPPKGQTAITPTWSPDGSLLLFCLAALTGTPHPADELAVVHADGTGLTPVVTTPDFKAQPEWIKAN